MASTEYAANQKLNGRAQGAVRRTGIVFTHGGPIRDGRHGGEMPWDRTAWIGVTRDGWHPTVGVRGAMPSRQKLRTLTSTSDLWRAPLLTKGPPLLPRVKLEPPLPMIVERPSVLLLFRRPKEGVRHIINSFRAA